MFYEFENYQSKRAFMVDWRVWYQTLKMANSNQTATNARTAFKAWTVIPKPGLQDHKKVLLCISCGTRAITHFGLLSNQQTITRCSLETLQQETASYKWNYSPKVYFCNWKSIFILHCPHVAFISLNQQTITKSPVISSCII